MISDLRKDVKKVMAEYSLTTTSKWKQKVLEVGIAGDPKPGGNYGLFGKGNDYKTLDVLPSTEPDYVMDICHTTFNDNSWDIVILSQTLEHIWNADLALKECHRITKKWAIIDIPMQYHYHPEDGFEDYWRFTPAAMEKLLKEVGFSEVDVSKSTPLLTTALCKK